MSVCESNHYSRLVNSSYKKSWSEKFNLFLKTKATTPLIFVPFYFSESVGWLGGRRICTLLVTQLPQALAMALIVNPTRCFWGFKWDVVLEQYLWCFQLNEYKHRCNHLYLIVGVHYCGYISPPSLGHWEVARTKYLRYKYSELSSIAADCN